MKNSKFYIIGIIFIILIIVIPTSFATDNTNTTNSSLITTNNQITHMDTNNTNTNNLNNFTTKNNNNTNTTNIVIIYSNDNITKLNPQNISTNISYATIESNQNNEDANDEPVLIDQLNCGAQSNKVVTKINLNTNIFKDNTLIHNGITQSLYNYIDSSLSINLNTGTTGSSMKINGKTFLGNIDLYIILSPGIDLLQVSTNKDGCYTLTTSTKFINTEHNNQIENTIINGLFGNSQKSTTIFGSNKDSGNTVSLISSNNFNNAYNKVNGTYKL